MVTYDISNRKTSKKGLKFGSKSQYCPKIPEIDLDFFRPKNKLSQFDRKIIAKSFGGKRMVPCDGFIKIIV